MTVALTVLDPLLAAMPFGEQLRQWVPALATVGAAVVLGRSGRWWTVEDAGTTALVLAITVTGFVFSSLIYLLPAGMSGKFLLHWPAYAVFFGGLAALLYTVDRLATTGRRALAWSASPGLTGPGSPPCCTGCPATYCAASGQWSARRPWCAGTVT